MVCIRLSTVFDLASEVNSVVKSDFNFILYICIYDHTRCQVGMNGLSLTCSLQLKGD